MKECLVVDLGMMPYAVAYELQRQLVTARKADAAPDVLLLCEHPHVITLGRNGKRENLLASDHLLRQMGVAFHESDRGGDITYHGPGQIVGYPVLNLGAIRRDVGWFVQQLEEVMIRAASDAGVSAARRGGMTGVWVETPRGEEKLGAIGVHLSRWVTSHGFAFNVATDLRYFDLMVPCGLVGKRATSLERVLERPVAMGAAKGTVASAFSEAFGLALREASRAELEEMLAGQEVLA